MHRTQNYGQLNCLIKRILLGPIWSFPIKHFWILYPSQFYTTRPERFSFILSSLRLCPHEVWIQLWCEARAASQPFSCHRVHQKGCLEGLFSFYIEHLLSAHPRKHPCIWIYFFFPTKVCAHPSPGCWVWFSTAPPARNCRISIIPLFFPLLQGFTPLRSFTL